MILSRTGGVLLSALLSGCALLKPLPEPSGLRQRLAAFPTDNLPLRQPVTIFWNAYQVPFIEAATDRDAAFALGLVHAHLRLGQIETMRYIARGRLAEIAGPLAADIDHALRILDLGRAAPASLAAASDSDRMWLESFVAGLNHYQARVRPLPHEYSLFGIDPHPFTPADLLTIGKLASVDVNWFVWSRLLPLRHRDDWPALWARLVRAGQASIPSFGPDDNPGAPWSGDALHDIFAAFAKSGSNSVVVAGRHSATGGALIASDPHLGFTLPNLWLLAGYKSPGYHVAGMMIPGLPFVAVGRNPDIAWGGTNLRAASSDLFDLATVPATALTSRRERIAIRWWPDRTVTIRESPLGPVLSDAPFIKQAVKQAVKQTVRQAGGQGGPGPFALRWIGHRASNELGAMLAVNRARDWPSFRQALGGFAVSGQNMLYADAQGHIGQVMAAHLPARPPGIPADLLLPPARAASWERIVTGLDLPAMFDPPAGFLASANNRGAAAEWPVGYFFSANDRIERLRDLVADKPVTVERLRALQQDVYMGSAHRLAGALAARATTLAGLPADAAALAAELGAWDGRFETTARAPVAFQLVVHHLVGAVFEAGLQTAYTTGDRLFPLLQAALQAGDIAIDQPLAAALVRAAAARDAFTDWGDMHRLRLAHPAGRLPWIGKRYRFSDDPVGGSSGTVMKTAHGLVAERHAARFGAQARHISDMADPDANFFLLLGGQDGWFNSTGFLDQLPLWHRGDSIRIPLTPAAVRRDFATKTVLRPG